MNDTLTAPLMEVFRSCYTETHQIPESWFDMILLFWTIDTKLIF